MGQYDDILTPQVQEYIRLDSTRGDFQRGVVKNPFPEVEYSTLMTQIKGLLKSETKLPHLSKNHKIVYPQGVSMEQCSSLWTSRYKASIVKGHLGADITGGFGVDTMAFSQNFDRFDYFEINDTLASVAAHNFSQMGHDNISVHATDGVQSICASDQEYDFVYADPARRDDNKSRVYSIEDCVPNMTECQDRLLEIAPVLMCKLSPMLDIAQIERSLHHVAEIHVVAYRGEVKEILVLQKRDWDSQPKIYSVDLYEDADKDFVYTAHSDAEVEYCEQGMQGVEYLYDASAAMRKSGLCDDYARSLGLKKVSRGTMLYASSRLVDGFCGRVFAVVGEVNKKNIRTFSADMKASVICRNFPERADVLKKKLKLKDGGEDFVLAFSTSQKKYVMMYCRKVKNA